MGNKRKRKDGSPARSPMAEARYFAEVAYCHEAALSGYTYPQIADLASTHFGKKVGVEWVRRRLVDYHNERIVENRDELRAKTLERYDRLLVLLDPILFRPEEVELATLEDGTVLKATNRGDQLKAMNLLLATEKARRELLGLDAPAKAELTVVELSTTDLELIELANEAKVRRAAVLDDEKAGVEP